MTSEEKSEKFEALGESLRELLNRAGEHLVIGAKVTPKEIPDFPDAVTVEFEILDRTKSTLLLRMSKNAACSVLERTAPQDLEVPPELDSHGQIVFASDADLERTIANLVQQLDGVGTGSARTRD